MTTSAAGAAASLSWAARALPRWTVLVWLPLCYTLLIAPVADTASGRSWPAWVAAAVAAGLFTGVVITRFRPGPRQQPIAQILLAALAVLAVVTTVAYAPVWSSLFVLLAIGMGVVLDARRAPPALVALTLVTAGTVLLGGGSVDETFTSSLTVLISGLGTYAFHQLFAVIAELRRTREELARMAVSEERERFGRDLHDLLGHTLSVIVVKAEAVRRLAPRDSVAAAEHAADIERIGREALTDVRRAASGYRGAGVAAELSRGRSALDAAGIELHVQQRPGGAALPDDADVLLGWTVREALTNVVRHSRASRCTVTVQQTDQRVRLEIVDDGAGRGEADRSGAGLHGLQQRVLGAGGTFEAGDTGHGFRVVVDVPCRIEVTTP